MILPALVWASWSGFWCVDKQGRPRTNMGGHGGGTDGHDSRTKRLDPTRTIPRLRITNSEPRPPNPTFILYPSSFILHPLAFILPPHGLLHPDGKSATSLFASLGPHEPAA